MSNKLYEENDIQNIANAIRNKNGTEDTYKVSQMSTAIDSIEVIEQQTAEGESLSLTNTKAMPYKDYVVKGKSEQNGEPSPSNPSEIHSVADDVNLFDASKIANSSISVTDNGKTIIMPVSTSGNGNTNTATKLNVLCPDLQVGDVIYIRFKRNLNNNKNKFIYLYGSNRLLNASENSPSYTITQEDLNSYVFLYGNDYDYGETEQCIITDFKIQKNTVPIKYSPYNQGTVTIKQRGKNLAKITNCNIIESDKTVEVINGIVKIQATSSNFNIDLSGGLITGAWAQNYSQATDYNLTEENLETYIFKVFFNKISGTGTASNRITIFTNQRAIDKYFSPQSTLQYISEIIQLQTNEHIKQIAYWNNGTNTNVDIEFYYQLEEGTTATDFEPYQTPHDYIIQTEPLRSLPNGVKDTIEADGIHRRERKTILDENNISIVSNFGYRYETPSVYIEKNKLGFKSGWEENICLMNKYKTITKTSLIATGTFSTNFTRGYIEIFNENFTDLQTAKEILLGTEIICQLSEEIIEPLTQNQATTMLDIIKTGSYEGTTNIYTDEDVKPTIGVEYYKKG